MRILSSSRRYLLRKTTILCLALFFATGTTTTNNNAAIAAGKILIANEALNDPNFDGAVVFIVGHNPLGTLGLIVNRPLENVQENALENGSPSPLPPRYRPHPSDDAVYFGGPVRTNGLRALARSRFEIPEAIHVMGELYFLDSAESIKHLFENEADNPTNAITSIRAYRGLSSWIPGQLEAEIQAGAWYVRNGNEEIVFSDNEHLWEQLISEIHSQWVQFKDSIIWLPDFVLSKYNGPATGHFAKK